MRFEMAQNPVRQIIAHITNAPICPTLVPLMLTKSAQYDKINMVYEHHNLLLKEQNEMLKQPILPSDIKLYIKKSITKRLVLFLALFVSLGALILLFADSFFQKTNENIKDSFCLLIMLIPFIVSGIPHKLFGSTWHGTIINVEHKVTTGTYMVGIRPFPYEKTIVSLTIEKENGRLVFKDVASSSIDRHKKMNYSDFYEAKKSEHLDGDYKIGDMICYFYGLKYPIIISDGEREQLFCAVCGHKNPKKNDKCFNCGHSIIK